MVAGADVVGHVDGGRHEVVCVRGVLVVVVQTPGEAEALALDVSTPAQSVFCIVSRYSRLNSVCYES